MRNFDKTPAVKKLEDVGRGLVAASLAAVLMASGSARAEEAASGTGRSAGEATFRVAPDGRGTTLAPTPSGRFTDPPALSPTMPGRTALDQPQCTICLTGAASVTWTGSSGSFHVDRIVNGRSLGVSGPLDLKMVLTTTRPVWNSTISSYAFSSALSFSPLSAGYMYAPVDSGTISFFGSTIPVGEYFLLLYLREYVGGTWYYVDWIEMNKKVSCNGAACSVINTSTCTEDAYTMCLLGGRYRVTGRWKNQYAGGAQANLYKAKLTDVTGAFWIADANTYEFMIRVNNATNNGRAWISILTFTDVEFWVAVTDVTNGQAKEYHSDPGNRTLIYDPGFFVYP